jgi:hypothetical protein
LKAEKGRQIPAARLCTPVHVLNFIRNCKDLYTNPWEL